MEFGSTFGKCAGSRTLLRALYRPDAAQFVTFKHDLEAVKPLGMLSNPVGPIYGIWNPCTYCTVVLSLEMKFSSMFGKCAASRTVLRALFRPTTAQMVSFKLNLGNPSHRT